MQQQGGVETDSDADDDEQQVPHALCLLPHFLNQSSSVRTRARGCCTFSFGSA
jgi:hypothetical protein